jgi:uncharacterized protein HemX
MSSLIHLLAMSYLSSWGRSLSVLVLLATGAVGGLLAVKDLSGLELPLLSAKMPLVESSQSPNRASPSASDTAVLLAIAAAGGTGLAFYAGKRSKSSRHSHRRISERAANTLNQASAHLKRKLLRLLHDDRAAATRLVNYAQIKYPDRSINWCVEKVIYDLERDRNRAG